MTNELEECELCKPTMIVFGDNNAYVRHDNHSLNPGHVLVIPRRHVSNFFDMTWDEKMSVVALLDQAKEQIEQKHSPDRYNIGVNIKQAGGQSRMHVHVHLIPRYDGDVADREFLNSCAGIGQAGGAKCSEY